MLRTGDTELPSLGAESRTVASSWEAMESPVPLSFNLFPVHNTTEPPERLNNGLSDLEPNSQWTTSNSISNMADNVDNVDIDQTDTTVLSQIPSQGNQSEQNSVHISHMPEPPLTNIHERVSNTERLETIRDVTEVDNPPTLYLNGEVTSDYGRERESSNDTVYRERSDNTQHRQSLVTDYTGELHQKTLLDLMTRGFRTFTCEMADVIIDKLNPEYQSLARTVAEEVKLSTATELKKLKETMETMKVQLQEKEAENVQLKETLEKERLKSKLELEREILKREKLTADQSALISNLQSELQKLQSSKLEKEKWVRKAEIKAKVEERKRIQVEEEYIVKLKDLQKQLDKVKGDLLVKKSVKRIQASSAKEPRSGAATRLISHHGSNRKRSTTYIHLPYQEGDS